LTRITSTLHEGQHRFYIITGSFLLRMRNVSDKFVEKIKYFMFRNYFWKTCHLCNNVEKHCRTRQATDDNMVRVHTCSIPKATNTHSEYGILFTVLLKQWLHKHTSLLHNMYIACLVCSMETTAFFAFICMFVNKIINLWGVNNFH
jgi:hypothetical protein